MTVEISRLDTDLTFEEMKKHIEAKKQEFEQDIDRGLSIDEQFRIERNMLGAFTLDEFTEISEVPKQVVQAKIKFWISIGDIEMATTTRSGEVVYRVITESA